MQTINYLPPNSFLESLLRSQASRLGPVFSDPERYQLQIIYTRIDRDDQNQPHCRDFTYRLDDHAYFYPASTIKLAAAALALEKLNDLAIPGLDRHTPMLTDSLPGATPAAFTDATSPSGLPSIGNYIKKILLVSDNDAFNRLYEFIGQESFNKELWAKGYPGVQVLHRLGVTGISPEKNRYTNAIIFRRGRKVIWQQPIQYSPLSFSTRNDKMGKAYYNEEKKLIQAPMDASLKNRVSLSDLHKILKSIIFPDLVTKSQRFRLKEDDYGFLYRCMSAQPEESERPTYDPAAFHHNYVKFLLFGAEKNNRISGDVRSFNKPGWAYGTLTDIAYIADFSHQVEFMLSTTVYVNDNNGILSDENYQFKQIGEPFMQALGELIYNYERQRQRAYSPDLSRFTIDYSKKAF
ncbi:serine hydrolase [Chitinophaga sancti]|uniref:Beta-lactamase enzyme family protein n=1 Tax=Chitinophaga sancti TaxID=1004 RepID=A0A1K1LUA7_9BACT|nr:serine hydrolase [Chitinophaga sancti]WQD64847.1 serine hydrolase [Chitinophaga sancti]WQG89529.1 serine hydrolase [Chitinophaga sancti]SFW14442.1 Beta-lactamase enzyme family protein [Chitinophaga sancti]